MLVQAITTNAAYAFASDVRAGLTRTGQKELPSKYLYDDVGSALFEVISRLPEYGLTRRMNVCCGGMPARWSIAWARPSPSPSWVAAAAKRPAGCSKRSAGGNVPFYYPVEISRSALAMCERELSDIDSISILGFEREYLDGLLEVAAQRRDGQHLLVLFLGSTIGNFDRPAGVKFLAEVRRILEPGDSLLLGTDLEKPSPQVLAAYDDELGVTAAFNLNLLARINRELDADFDLRQFSHVARINEEARSVEMHLQSQRRQTVRIPAAELQVEFLEGETNLDGKQPQICDRGDFPDGTRCRFPL